MPVLKTWNGTAWVPTGGSPASGFDYTETTNPFITTNPTAVGATWINTTSGEIFVCTDATTDANVWVGQMGTTVT